MSEKKDTTSDPLLGQYAFYIYDEILTCIDFDISYYVHI